MTGAQIAAAARTQRPCCPRVTGSDRFTAGSSAG